MKKLLTLWLVLSAAVLFAGGPYPNGGAGTALSETQILAPYKSAIDTANEEVSADFDAAAALVTSNYSDISAAIASKGVDMTGIIPSGYDTAIENIPAASGDAVASDVLSGITFSNDSGSSTGTRPCVTIPKTGQTTSYATGDDGDIEAGYTCTGTRFTDNGDGTVRDNATGLMWPKDISAGNSNDWAGALTYADSFSGGGYTDWRRANIREVLSLFDYGRANPALPNGHPFTMTSVTYIWTSNTSLATTANAYYVVAGDGTLAQTAKTNNWPHTALPVRGGNP